MIPRKGQKTKNKTNTIEHKITSCCQGWAGMTFWTLGTGIAQPIPKFWEREWEWKLHSQFLGMGTGMRNRIPDIWEREWDLHSRLLGTGMRHWYSREWSGTGMTFKNTVLFGTLSQNGKGPYWFNIIESHFGQTYIFSNANIQKCCYETPIFVI